MDKNINDNDRIIIGVREWAVQEVLNWNDGVLLGEDKIKRTDILTGIAQKLEEYVLRDIKDKEKD